jgi:methyl-accepting chemotaxis protein
MFAESNTKTFEIGSDLNQWMVEKVSTFNDLVATASSRDNHDEILQDLTLNLKNDKDFLDLYLGFESDGEFIDATGWIPDEGWDPRGRPWYKAAKRDNGIIFSKFYQDDMTGKLVVSIAKPYYVDGEFQGVFGADISLDKISQLVDNYELEHGYFFIIDQDTSFLVHPNKDLIGTDLNDIDGMKSIGADIVSGKRGFTEYIYKNEDKVMFYIPLSYFDTFLGYSITNSDFQETIRNFQKVMITIIILSSVILLISLYFLVKILLKPLDKLNDSIKEFANGNGDLTKRLKIESNDEIGIISKSFNKYLDTLSHLMHMVLDSSNSISSTAEELSASSEEVNSSTTQVATTVQEVAKGSQILSTSANETKQSIVDLISSINTISNTVSTTTQISKEAQDLANKGKESAKVAGEKITKISEVVSSSADIVQELGKQSAEITKVVEVINNISEETNLLALNAAIEAARAGEAGRGFAVVADQVRKLAEESQKATKQIEDMIQNISNATVEAVSSMDSGKREVDEGSKVISNALSSLETITKKVDEIASHFSEIDSLTKEQLEKSSVVQKSVDSVSSVAEESAASTEEVSASVEETNSSMQQVAIAAQQLAKNGENLREVVSKFKL